jgi:hypothetical protein
MNVQNLKLQFSQDRPSNVANLRLQFSSPETRPVARTQIPVARFGPGPRPPVAQDSAPLANGHPTSPTGTHPADRWRLKYEEAEKKRKTLLTQNQKRECLPC